MKRTCYLIAFLIILTFPRFGIATDCNNVNIPEFLPPALKIQTVRDALADYKQGGIYGICFQMDSPLQINAAVEPFELIIPSSETNDVYVKGLRLENSDTIPIMEDLLKVSHSGSGELVLTDFAFKNIKKGLLLKGNGKVSIKSSKFSGDASKYGPCIEVQNKGALLDKVDVSKCAVGIFVKGNNVKINNSKSRDNKVGVNIASGIIGTDIQRTQIYGNDDGNPLTSKRSDGIRIEDGVPHALAFYDLVGGEPVPVADDSESIELTDKDVNILVPLPEGEEESARVEFYFSGGSSCGAESSVTGQAACYVGEGISNPVEFTAASLEEGKLSIEIPPEHYDKSIVAIYTDPELGTAGISPKFKVDSGGVVAFVSNPYDIPTTGGATDTGGTSDGGGDVGDAAGYSDDEEDSAGSSMGGEAAMTEGGGGIISAAGGAAGGCGGGASLAGDTFRTAVLCMDLWWNLLIVGLILGLRKVYVRARHHGHKP